MTEWGWGGGGWKKYVLGGKNQKINNRGGEGGRRLFGTQE